MELQIEYERLRDRALNGGMGRRGFLAQIARMAIWAGVVAPGITRFAGTACAAPQSVRYDGFGGYSQEAFDRLVLQPFTKKTGIAVTQGTYSDPDTMMAQLQAEGIDHYNYFWAAQELTPIQLARRGWASDLDESKMPRLGDLSPMVLDRNRKQGGGKLLSVPYCLSGGAIVYNTKLIAREEVQSKGFNILIDPKLKGSLSGYDNWQYRIYYGALQSGQDPNNITDMDAIWDKIRQSKSLVLKYFKATADQVSLMTTGSVTVSEGWFVPIYNLIKRGQPIQFWPVEGSYTQFGSMVALKGSSLDAFYEMVDILLRPDVSFALAMATGNLPLLDPKKVAFPTDVQAIPGYDPSGTFAGYRSFDPVYWEKNGLTWQREYTRVMSRG